MNYDPLIEVIDAPIEIDESTVTKLHILRVVEKFGSLPGENTAEEKERLSAVLNDLLGRLIDGEHFGTELESIMDVLGIESSDGLLAAYLGGI